MFCLDERKKTLAFTHFSKKQHRDVKETLKIRAYKSVFSHLWGSCHLTAQNAVNYKTLRAVYVQFLNERCCHMFLAFFNKKRRYRLKLEDGVALCV